MLERAGSPCFSQDMLGRVGCIILTESLYDDGASQGFLFREANEPHTTFGEGAFDFQWCSGACFSKFAKGFSKLAKGLEKRLARVFLGAQR